VKTIKVLSFKVSAVSDITYLHHLNIMISCCREEEIKMGGHLKHRNFICVSSVGYKLHIDPLKIDGILDSCIPSRKCNQISCYTVEAESEEEKIKSQNKEQILHCI
jgi:hypothetical protein